MDTLNTFNDFLGLIKSLISGLQTKERLRRMKKSRLFAIFVGNYR